MRYGSVCSGIEAATVAWHSLGWEPAFFSEIEKFPRQVLAHHYPDVPLHGDFTTIKGDEYGAIDLLVGGTPCQSFSVAGLRKGLSDPRGNLMLEYGALAKRLGAKWLVWENVPGVLSANGGRDFGTFLGMLAELGYGFAYRVPDAQYVRTDGYPHAVPQRRRRVFVVGHLGSWQRAAAVLFDTESLRGNPPPRREAGQAVAGTIGARTGRSIGAQDAACEHLLPTGAGHGARSGDSKDEYIVPVAIPGNCIGRKPENGGNGLGADDSGVMYTLTKTDVHAVATLIQFDTTQITSKQNGSNPQVGDPCHPLARGAHAPAIAAHTFKVRGGGEGGGKGYLGQDDAAFTLSTGIDQHLMTPQMQVRRLTPRECERLQGFPDDYTDIQPNGKATADGPRYKALGNSMAVPVMRWIGERIQAVEAIGK